MPLCRRGKKAVTIWVDPLVAEQLKEIAFHHKKPQQDLFLEALNILFAKYGRPEIALTGWADEAWPCARASC